MTEKNKIIELKALVKNRLDNIMDNPTEYRSFLKSIAKLNTYRFDEQIQIYAQNPNASACASFKVWNEVLHCFVKKGTKGIALLPSDEVDELNYIYDIKDVARITKIGKYPNIWKMENGYHEGVIKALSEAYNCRLDNLSLQEAIERVVENLTEKKVIETIEILKEDQEENSLLKNITENELRNNLTSLINESVRYIVMERCSQNPDSRKEEYSFQQNELLKGKMTEEEIYIIGRSLSTAARDLLKVIGKEVTKQEKSLANRTNIRYNENNIKSENNYNEREDKNNGENRDNIQSSRGLSDTEHSSTEETDRRSNEIREDETGISAKSETREIYENSQSYDDEGTFIGDSKSSGEHGEESDRNNEQISSTGFEEDRSNRMGEENYGNQEPSRKGSTGTSGLSVITEKDIQTVLCSDYPYTKKTKKKDVIAFFEKEHDTVLRTKYIESIYDETHCSFGEKDLRLGCKGFFDKNQEETKNYDFVGLMISEGYSFDKNHVVKLSWTEVQERISEYIESGLYVADKEIKKEPVERKKTGKKDVYEQLDLFSFMLPTEEQQKEAIAEIEAEEIAEAENLVNEKKYTYMNPKEEPVPHEYLTKVLTRGTGFVDGKIRVYQLYQKELNANEREKRIKKEFGEGGYSSPIDGYGLHGMNTFQSKGISIQWVDQEGEKRGLVSWSNVEKEIARMIREGSYVSEEELEKYARKQEILTRVKKLKAGDYIEIEGNQFEVETTNYDDVDAYLVKGNEETLPKGIYRKPELRSQEQHDNLYRITAYEFEKNNFKQIKEKEVEIKEESSNVPVEKDYELALYDAKNKRYLSIQTFSEGGYDYSFYTDTFTLIDGGIYKEETDLTIREAAAMVLGYENVSNIQTIDFDYLNDKVNEESSKEIKKNNEFRDIEKFVMNVIKETLEENGLENEVELLQAKVYGSRATGEYHESSDIDVLIQYKGSINEDTFFNIIHEDENMWNGIEIDVNPIKEEKSGTIEEYLKATEQYQNKKEVMLDSIEYQNAKSFYDLVGNQLKERKEKLYFQGKKGFLPVMIDNIGKDEYSITFINETSGRTLYDSQITFYIRNEELHPVTYRSEEDKVIQDVGSVTKDIDLKNELNHKLKEWFQELEERDYKQVETLENATEEEQSENIYDDYSFEENEYEIVYTDEVNEIIEESNKTEVKELQPLSEKEDYKDIPSVPGVNYEIKEKDLGVGTPKEKYQYNIAAIKVMKQVEAEKRNATLEEQEILSKYVGWGGLQNAFDSTVDSWNKEYNELRSYLNDSEYESARSSTLNAHYTSPTIITAMYKALDKIGFEKGNILEPSMGIGNFFGMLPSEMKKSRLYGVELDSVSGRIAKLLYPNAKIEITGFEKSSYQGDFFDVAIGNVPFGDYQVSDKKYDKYGFRIHDYFFVKTLDKLRPGGVLAFVTSKGSMDKKNSAVRKYLAQRAELLGAIRLPNTAFKANAGTEVTSDILFLQKRERIIETEPEWVNTGVDENGLTINQYFINNPEMIMGTMKEVSGPYGMETTCIPFEEPLEDSLNRAVTRIKGEYEEVEVTFLEEELSNNKDTIPADPSVKNYSYTIIDGEIYYRQDSVMTKAKVAKKNVDRLKTLLDLKENTMNLINAQVEDQDEETINTLQKELNEKYDNFVQKYGYIENKENEKLMSNDSGYNLLCSLEEEDENTKEVRKTKIFSARTVKPSKRDLRAETSEDALVLSMQEKAYVDLDYMNAVSGIEKEKLIDDLKGSIYFNPESDEWEQESEYLSGNIRHKLEFVKLLSMNDKKYLANVAALESAMPKDLTADEISIKLGAPWIKPQYIEDFMREEMKTPWYLMRHGRIKVEYAKINGNWIVEGKNYDSSNITVTTKYGTQRKSGYEILEDSLNLRESKVYDRIENEKGNMVSVLNRKETMLAAQKQDLIRNRFKDWIFENPERREDICNTYNNLFNSIRPREYDGSKLVFPGMSNMITLKEHQKNAVARMLYGKNALLAHAVGAGKTYEICTAIMEGKRIGQTNKALIVVPNHLTGQWAKDFVTLYPNANILAANESDFKPDKRKTMCARIATGDYDAIIIGHTQFEKIPLSVDIQRRYLQEELNGILQNLEDLKYQSGSSFTIKQLEKEKKQLNKKLEELISEDRKDDVVTFEQLGIDRLYVDEAHYYKNLFLYTKMSNVAGISQTAAAKSADMYMKTQYMNEITGGKGVVFATGTPISNSMTELYTMMRYLQKESLEEQGLELFDSWAATFGETITDMELNVEGTGYRMKTRFAKFYNLPELMSLFKEVADIKTADMLDLDVPTAEPVNVTIKATDFQKAVIKSLGERADQIRNGGVDPTVDNMLNITMDGRKLALDQRLYNPDAPEVEDCKINRCAENVYNVWNDSMPIKGTQLIFCDTSTYKKDSEGFNVYVELRNKLIEKGIPEEEIAFIQEYKKSDKKEALFNDVRNGKVRVLIGSTQTMGAGTNVQNRMIALHHIDVPWRPSDIEQQEGRILRRGNMNKTVKIFRYVTEGTFDAYSWQTVEKKQQFISQVMTSKSLARSCNDVDDAVLNYAEIKAMAVGNPLIKERMDLECQIQKMEAARRNHKADKYRLEDNINKYLPTKLSIKENSIREYEKDIEKYQEYKRINTEIFEITVMGKKYTDKNEAAEAINACKKLVTTTLKSEKIGSYCGFEMELSLNDFGNIYNLSVNGICDHRTELGQSIGIITRMDNVLQKMPEVLTILNEQRQELLLQLEEAKKEVALPYEKEEEYQEKLARLKEVTLLLENSEKENEEKENENEVPPESTWNAYIEGIKLNGSVDMINLPEGLKNESSFIIRAVNVDPNCFRYASDRLRNNEEVVKEVLRLDITQKKYCGNDIDVNHIISELEKEPKKEIKKEMETQKNNYYEFEK